MRTTARRFFFGGEGCISKERDSLEILSVDGRVILKKYNIKITYICIQTQLCYILLVLVTSFDPGRPSSGQNIY
jgi:hypothetical protein